MDGDLDRMDHQWHRSGAQLIHDILDGPVDPIVDVDRVDLYRADSDGRVLQQLGARVVDRLRERCQQVLPLVDGDRRQVDTEKHKYTAEDDVQAAHLQDARELQLAFEEAY